MELSVGLQNPIVSGASFLHTDVISLRGAAGVARKSFDFRSDIIWYLLSDELAFEALVEAQWCLLQEEMVFAGWKQGSAT
jgi:hypothetical protein